ncbi:hypothetical protein Thiowin_03401 [Thiorhodovibrio winogradskyi]|uniref:Uncharacterized protein n=1 Tax=Thiorhodovibrio winogradskyi TaxID=77007 RepID=A0ABZ0SCL0_9GAMM|nr:hypothetical protein [Thiorhodovibrio winogradskyi]
MRRSSTPNVFLYHLDDSDLRKHDIAARLIREAIDTGNACTSYQVVQECLSAGLRKAHIPLDAERARDYLDTVLVPLWFGKGSRFALIRLQAPD